MFSHRKQKSKYTDIKAKILEDVRTLRVPMGSVKEHCRDQEQSDKEDPSRPTPPRTKDMACRGAGRMAGWASWIPGHRNSKAAASSPHDR